MIIPHRKLSPEALAGVIEEYVTRDGTEMSEASDKAATVARLLDRGELVLVYDEEAETCNILSREEALAPPPELPTGRRRERDRGPATDPDFPPDPDFAPDFDPDFE